MLRKASSWVSSPLAVNLLLKACGTSGPVVEKYTQIGNFLVKNEENRVRSKIFITSAVEDQNKYGILDGVTGVDFKNDGEKNAISDWINQHTDDHFDIKDIVPVNAQIVLINIHNFKDKWKGDNNGSPPMKVYNSFNYTQDVQYEARLLELPTSGGFKLILLTPNETDVLPELIYKLNNEGLKAAASCIQPVFTTTTKLEAPSINFRSRIAREQEVFTTSVNATCLYHGNVKINSEGIIMDVLTCIFSGPDSTCKAEDNPSTVEHQSGFYFALTFKDTPIFTGQYYP